jgi:hypothetical protein
VGLRSDLDDNEKRKFLTQHRLELRPLDRLAHSQSLYRLRIPAPHVLVKIMGQELIIGHVCFLPNPLTS